MIEKSKKPYSAYVRYKELAAKNMNSNELVEYHDLMEYLGIVREHNQLVEEQEAVSTLIEQIHTNEHESLDLTLPGYNYLGPGTKVIHNYINNVLPVDQLDKIAYEHDWDYLVAENTNEILTADKKFNTKALYNGSLITPLMINIKNKLINNENFLSNLTAADKELLRRIRTMNLKDEGEVHNESN